ncbi:MAG: hypothetical protein GY941_27215 [Planctomycetes bacterium]|nr:hypothetical protein [Planctomycetota bacterium]
MKALLIEINEMVDTAGGRLEESKQKKYDRRYTHYEVVLGISGPVWSWNVRTRLPEILIFRLNKTIGLVMLSRGFCD